MPNNPLQPPPSTARPAGSFVLPSDDNVLGTPPLSPSVVRHLQTLGIHTLTHLQQVGAVKAFALLKTSGLTITQTVLWQLAALEWHTQAHQLRPEDKKRIQDALKQLPPQHLPPALTIQHQHMRAALEQARLALQAGEIPIGAVVVYQDAIIATAHNECIKQHFVGAHAEMLALARAGKALGNYRLHECDVYVTVEPCVMCCSALLQARVKRVFYGISEPKTGGVISQVSLSEMRSLNSHTAFFADILGQESQLLMQEFFQSKR